MEHPDPVTKWKNMRRMAWSALVAGLVYPVGVYLLPEARGLVDMAGVFYAFAGATVGAYMGFSTWGDKK